MELRLRSGFVAVLAALLLIHMPDTVRGQCLVEGATRLVPEDGEELDRFGAFVAMDGDVMAVAATGDDDAAAGSGAVLVYRFDGADWEHEATLTAPDAAGGDNFGRVAILGNVLVVGAPYHEHDGLETGAAYVYRYDPTPPGTWAFEQELLASNAQHKDELGMSVSVFDNVIVVGARQRFAQDVTEGKALVYRYDGAIWNEEAILTASDGKPEDEFGFSVAVQEDLIFVGASLAASECNGNPNCRGGAAYVFRREGESWAEQAKLTADDPRGGVSFGRTLAAQGDLVLIAAPHANDAEPGTSCNSGAVYAFRQAPGEPGTWHQEIKLLASDASCDAWFGFNAVALDGDYALIGAFSQDRAPGFGQGAAYLIDTADWTEVAKLIAADAMPGDSFAFSTAISGNHAVVGAHQTDEACPGDPECQSGSAFAFRGWTSDCNDNGIRDLCDLRVGGLSDDCNFNGVPDECEPPDDCNLNGEPDVCDLADGTSADCNDNDVPDECDIADGTSQDLDGDGIPDECIDCNNNGVPDSQDIGNGTSQDCNGNDVPDECENDCNSNGIEDSCDLTDGTSPDCNDNTIPDECDIAAGQSPDENGDGIPDECNFACSGEHQKLIGEQVGERDTFGAAVAAQGDVLVVGAPRRNHITFGLGSVHVFRRSGGQWIQEQRLWDATAGQLGTSVDVDGGRIIAGAPSDGQTAHVYRFEAGPFPQWVEEAVLHGAEVTNNDSFGRDVAIAGDLVVVGSPDDDDQGSSSGSAYIFRFDGTQWQQEARVVASDGSEDAYFGESVAIVGETVLVGAALSDAVGQNSGAVYVFDFDGQHWNETTILTASNTQTDDRFGGSIDTSGDLAIISANSANDDGVAYIFRRVPDPAQWVEVAVLEPFDTFHNLRFGTAVALHDDLAVVGTLDFDGYNGSAYLFAFDGVDWVFKAKLQDFNTTEFQGFGEAVAAGESEVFVGAREHDGFADNAGAVFVYSDLEVDCNANGFIDFCEIANGTNTDCDESGVPDDCEALDDCDLNGVPDLCDVEMSDCNDNAVPDSCDINEGTSDDCNANGIPDECDVDESDCNANGMPDDCDVAQGNSDDCNANNLPDECDIDGGVSTDCNTNDVPDECESLDDCNDNQSPDVCDLLNGVSDDCNGNNLPDECDIAEGTSEDCNKNAVPDECDVAVGPAMDCNVNAIPDACEQVEWLFVASRDTGTILRYDAATGSFCSEFADVSADVPDPGGIAFPANMSMYVSGNSGASLAERHQTSGAALRMIGSADELNGPRGIVLGPDASLLVASRNTDEILQYNLSDGSFRGVFSADAHLDGPLGITYIPGGNLLVASSDNDQVLEFDAQTGAFVRVFIPAADDPQPTAPDKPFGIEFGPNGNLYVASQLGDQILEYDGASGHFVGVFAEGCNLDNPSWFAFRSDGSLLATTRAADAVVAFDATGACIDADFASGGGLMSPTGIAIRSLDVIDVDCNANGIEDAQDIAVGSSGDNNINDIPDECEGTIVQAWSCLLHDEGGPNETELCINLNAANGVEPRLGGPQKLLIVMSDPIDPATVLSQNVQVACVNQTPPAHGVQLVGPASITVDFDAHLADQDCCEVTFTGLADMTGQGYPDPIALRSLAGDMNFSGGVTGGDALLIKPHLGGAVDPADPQFDFDRSIFVTGGDYALIKPRFGLTAPLCP